MSDEAKLRGLKDLTLMTARVINYKNTPIGMNPLPLRGRILETWKLIFRSIDHLSSF